MQADIGRYIGADIIEKVLLRDLPSLYGIQDVQELNALFTTLAFNTAGELSLEGLSQDSGVSKPTLKRYLEYLEAAFLIKVVHRIDHGARRLAGTRIAARRTDQPLLLCRWKRRDSRSLFGANPGGRRLTGARRSSETQAAHKACTD